MAAEETAAGLRSPEMMVTGLNQHLVMNALNSELLDGSHQTRNTETTDKLLLLNFFILIYSVSDLFSFSDSSNDFSICEHYSYLTYLIVFSCVVSCFLAVILGLILRDMMTFPLRPQDTTALTTLKV